MIRQFELVEKVRSYDPNADEDLLNRAYVFAMKAHGTQTRASGDPYFSHPLEVAGILTGYKLDTASIVTALLHDTIEDTRATFEEIENQFGPGIAKLVDGVTKLSLLELQSDSTKQAENFRKLLLAMSEDIRVLLVKLADRLHNMRTLHHIPNPEKRGRIALETMEIYAPLAERVGMKEVKDELEEIAFREINQEGYNSITKRLEFLRNEAGTLVDSIVAEIQTLMDNSGIAASVSGREKTPYSIWRKMQHKNVGFEQLADIMAFRVVTEDTNDCYHALGALHQKYRVVPGRVKDYISTPKPNGYRSLHTGIIGPSQQRVEIQIRTRDMHHVAELGVAAHWIYKQSVPNTEGRQYHWLRELLDILEHAESPEDFLEHTKLEMFQDQVFCFTPKGDLITLPRGATPIDFAYAVHSEVGDTCVGAKINGRMAQLKTELHNGDQVKIMTSKAQTPSPVWERFVVTGKARARIRRFVRAKQHSEYVTLGRAILERAFAQEGHEFEPRKLLPVRNHFGVTDVDELLASVGEGVRPAGDVLSAVFPGMKRKPVATPRRNPNDQHVNAIPIRGLIGGMAVHYSSCCHPLPGDRIVGIVTSGKGVSIHTIDCDTLENFTDSPERWLDVAWVIDKDAAQMFVGRMKVTLSNEPGSLGDLSTAIARNEGNIINLRITNRSSDFFEMEVDVEVHDVKHLSAIIGNLRATPTITSVNRMKT
ncbi:MAG: bifunctional (p)ppGpp synthetase/guanosine-3',5'-bis(diphosphate) 3'-pyrophosphohydrolase [Rhodospirillales bacterium]